MRSLAVKKCESGKEMEQLIKIAEQACAQNVPQMPYFTSGDTVNVSYRIKEGNKERIQQYAGVVIQVRGEGMNKRFTVRKNSCKGFFVERVFPMNSPFIAGVEVLKVGDVRRSRVYYVRHMKGKKRLAERLRRRPTKKALAAAALLAQEAAPAQA